MNAIFLTDKCHRNGEKKDIMVEKKQFSDVFYQKEQDSRLWWVFSRGADTL